MATFIVRDSFQYGGFRRAGNTLTVSDEIVGVEIALGKHRETGRPVSGLLNHCDPADADTEQLLAEFTGAKQPDREDPVQSAAVRKNLMEEFVLLEIPFDRRWSTERMGMELVKAKKARGL